MCENQTEAYSTSNGSTIKRPRINDKTIPYHSGRLFWSNKCALQRERKESTKRLRCSVLLFTTKAVNFEFVSDLLLEAFIRAITRCTGRRGKCQKLYCDNATNFVSANNVLKEIIHTKTAQEKILTVCNTRGIEFCFIPPRAPQFGGLWEAPVKSAKGLLKPALAASSLTYEELQTLIVETEAILNSRPLTAISSDPNDMTALTPGYFLIGSPLTLDQYTTKENITNLTRWKLVQQLKEQFWKRWSQEHLTGLLYRYKWKQECQNIKRDTLVIVKDDNLPPLKWILKRIENTIAGADKLVRVADVRTSHNIIRRPIHKLTPLPISQEENVQDLQPTSPKATATKSRTGSGTPGLYYERIGLVNSVNSNWN